MPTPLPDRGLRIVPRYRGRGRKNIDPRSPEVWSFQCHRPKIKISSSQGFKNTHYLILIAYMILTPSFLTFLLHLYLIIYSNIYIVLDNGTVKGPKSILTTSTPRIPFLMPYIVMLLFLL